MLNQSGHELRDNNEKIIKYLTKLRNQRKEMHFLIEKQETEKHFIENELEKLSFKLTLLIKSLGQRMQARGNYDKTINEIEQRYTSLVEESGKLLTNITKEVELLDEIMDKKIGTTPTASPEHSGMIHSKSRDVSRESSKFEPEPRKGSSLVDKELSSISSSASERSAKRFTKDSPKDSTKDSPRNSTKGSPRSSTKNSPRNSTKGSPRGSTKDSPRNSTKGSPTDSEKNSQKGSAKSSPKGTPKSSPRTSQTPAPKAMEADDLNSELKKYVDEHSQESFEIMDETLNTELKSDSLYDYDEKEQRSVTLDDTKNEPVLLNKVVDEEVQSFREAYGRQHK